MIVARFCKSPSILNFFTWMDVCGHPVHLNFSAVASVCGNFLMENQAVTRESEVNTHPNPAVDSED